MEAESYLLNSIIETKAVYMKLNGTLFRFAQVLFIFPSKITFNISQRAKIKAGKYSLYLIPQSVKTST